MSVFFFYHSSISAHTNVVETSPKDGEILTVSPQQIGIEFSDKVTGNVVNIELLDVNSKPIQLPQVRNSDHPNKVMVEVPELKKGTYTVNWSLVSADGHPTNGFYSFSVQEKSERNEAISNGNNESLSNETSNSQLSEILMVILRYLVEGLVLIGAGLTWMNLFARRYQLPDVIQKLGKWKVIFIGIVVFGLIAELFLYVSLMPNVDSFFKSPFSTTIIIQLLLLLLLFMQNVGNKWYAFIWTLLVMSFSFTGHVWVTNPNWLAISLRIVHVVSIAVWIGSIVYLAFILVQKVFKQIEFEQKRFRTFFSYMAGVSFGLALLSGEMIVFLQTRNWILVGPDSLWTTILNIKILAVLVITVLAVRQTSKWKSDVKIIDRRLLLIEIVVAILVLLAGVWMSQISFPTTL